MSEFTYNVNGLVSDSEATFATVQRALADAMARPPTAADEVRALAAVAEAEGKPCVLPDELIARLEAEARAVLAEVEPVHAATERGASLGERALSRVVIPARPGAPAHGQSRDTWRPRATRTPSGWSIAGGWLDEAVPELPTRGVANAGGVAPMLVDPEHADGDDAVQDRYGCGPVFVPVTMRDPLPVPEAIRLLRPRCDLSERELAEMNPGRVVARWDGDVWHLDRRASRKASGSGWCSRLGATLLRSRRSTRKSWRGAIAAHDRVIAKTDAAWTAERAAIVRAKGEGT